MRTKLLLFFSPMLLLVGGFILFVALTDAALPPSQRRCPVAVAPEIAKAAGHSYAPGVWVINSQDGTVPAPKVEVATDKSVSAPGIEGASCKLSYSAATSGHGLDWRIGHIFDDVSALRGRTVTFRFVAKADRPVSLDTGTAYLYDGQRVNGVTVSKLDQAWQEFVIVHAVPQNATRLELWFRLLLDRGSLEPGQGTIHFAAALQPGAISKPAAPSLQQVPEGQQAVTCHMTFGPALAPLLPSSHNQNVWSVYRFDGSVPAPQATVTDKSPVPAPGGRNACQIRYTGAPENPGADIDWRVGHTITAPISMRGRTVTLTVDYAADRPVEADSATIYLYDGVNFVSQPITQLGTAWQEQSVKLQVATDASTLQAWLRLTLDKGTVKPGSGAVYFSARLE